MWKTLSKDVRKFGAQCSFLALQFVNKEDQGAKNTSCYQVEDLSINGNQTNFTILFNSAIKEISTCSWSAYMGPGWRRPPMCGHAGAPNPGWVEGVAIKSVWKQWLQCWKSCAHKLEHYPFGVSRLEYFDCSLLIQLDLNDYVDQCLYVCNESYSRLRFIQELHSHLLLTGFWIKLPEVCAQT